MHVSRLTVFKIFPFLFSILIWALLEADGPGESHSGSSLDDILAQLIRVLPTDLRGDESHICTHKAALTQSFSQGLSAEYPRKNVLIYYHRNSTFNGNNAIHKSIELTANGQNTGEHTYEIQIFDSGIFRLGGEGGYHNWAFAGNWSQRGNVVRFHPIDESIARHRSGRASAKLGGGRLPTPSLNTSLESRDYEPDPEMWTISEGSAEGSEGSYSTVFDAASGGSSSSDSVVAYSAIDWSVDGELIAEGSIIGPEGAVVAAIVVLVLAIIAISAVLIDALIAWSHRNANERTFTQSTAAQLSGATPSKNTIVFHNQDSYMSFVGWTHAHHEMKIGDPFHDTVGFESYVFDYGNFTLSGDGGYENWAFFGNWYRDQGSPNVIFYPRIDSNCHRSSDTRALDSDEPLKLRHPIPPQIPTRQHADTTDGYYFVDCVKPDKTLALGIAYYLDMEPSGGNVGQLPDDFAEVHSNHAGMKAWQGESDILLGNVGKSLHWTFMHQDNGDDHMTVGVAHTPAEQLWLYKDAGALLFNSTANWACNSLYYAF